MNEAHPTFTPAPIGTLSVLVVDDHPMVRLSIVNLLRTEPGLAVCDVAGTAARAVDLCRSLRPDIVLLDLRLPDASGADAVRSIRREAPETKIVIFSSSALEEDVFAALNAGARAYVLKSAEPETLIDVIRRVAAGERYMSSDVAIRLAQREGLSDLTDRERDVLGLLVRGKRNREIASDLGIGAGTVKTYIANILDKLNATGRTQAAMIAVDRGIVRLDHE